MLKLRSAKTVREYYDNAIKKDSTKGHTTIKSLLYEEIENIPDYGINKYGKKLIRNVSAYVKRRHRYIFNTNFLEKGEEKSARKTIREYLYRYVQDNESDSEDRTDGTNEMTPNERDEELVALLEIDENELDYTPFNNLMKIKVNNPGIVDPISADFDEIIERLSKLEQKLSIEKEMHSYVTGLQRLKFLFKNIVPVVGDRRIRAVEDLDLYKKIGIASRHLMKEYKNKVPLSITCPGKVEGKDYILATVKLPRGTPVYNLPVEYNGFPVIVDYGAMKASTSETSDRCREYHENLKPGISISDSKCYEAFTLGTLFTAESQSGKKYLLTVNYGVKEVGSSVVQPGNIDNIDIDTPRCATVTKYKDLSIDKHGQLLDFAFCEVDNERGLLATNKPCGSDIIIEELHSTLDYEESDIIPVQKVGRTTGHTAGIMENLMQEAIVTETFKKDTYAKMLIVTNHFGDLGDSGAPVYDDDGLWGIYQSTSDSKYMSGVVPIDLILQKIYEKEHVNFDLLKNEGNVDEENGKNGN
ncbi:hypothetical protein RhiirA4_425380 [Rhizophagus irregularis]|uniref:Uncharacterized protein n=1 Tax=Rhizophagus irregularis TaxID=588596 RepID=A0A2I1H112_9GLOM|nr:hypothetical protein RhiirA4_425380 [Rhizophagus irregularis]